MARTGMLRGASVELAGRTKRKPMKRSRTKLTPIRRAARGQDCTIRLPEVCNFNPETTVLCHSNKLADGKGMGIKAADSRAAFGCSACHDVLDGRTPRPEGLTVDQVDACFLSGIRRTQSIVEMMGLLK